MPLEYWQCPRARPGEGTVQRKHVLIVILHVADSWTRRDEVVDMARLVVVGDV